MDPESVKLDATADEGWMAVARLLRPQGRRGELLTEPLTDLPEVFTKGRQFRIAPAGHSAAQSPRITLEDCWRPRGRNAGRLVLKLAGIDSISAAEELGNRQLFIKEADLPALDPDTFLVRDLVGCALFDGETRLGTVADLQFPVGPDGRTRLPDAVDLLVLEPDNVDENTEPVLIPFVKAWLSGVDTDAKRIVMHLPPGLLE